MFRLLRKDPLKRLSLEAALGHPWVLMLSSLPPGTRLIVKDENKIDKTSNPGSINNCHPSLRHMLVGEIYIIS